MSPFGEGEDMGQRLPEVQVELHTLIGPHHIPAISQKWRVELLSWRGSRERNAGSPRSGEWMILSDREKEFPPIKDSATASLVQLLLIHLRYCAKRRILSSCEVSSTKLRGHFIVNSPEPSLKLLW